MTSNSFFKYINSNFWSFLLITIIIISFFIFGDFWKFCIDALWVDPIVSQFIGNEWWIISICSLFIVPFLSRASTFFKQGVAMTLPVSYGRLKDFALLFDVN